MILQRLKHLFLIQTMIWFDLNRLSMFSVTHQWWRRRKVEWEWVRVTSWQSFAKEIQMRMREWIHWESANNGVLLEYKASCWENGESWRTELTKWISHLLKGSRMLRDPKNPVHSIASCPRSIALRTHFNGNHFDRKFSESHIFLFLLLHPHTTTKTRKKQIGWKNYLQRRRHHRTPTSRWGSCRGGTRSWRSYLSHISTSWKNISWKNTFTSWTKYFYIMSKYFHIMKEYFHTVKKYFHILERYFQSLERIFLT